MTDVIPTPTGQQTKTLVEIEGDMNRARVETAGPVPLIQDGTDPVLVLPRGLYMDGTWHTRLTVRELTGVDEEALARVKTVQEMYDIVLALGTVSVGSLELAPLPLAERQGHLQQLLLGERDQVYIAVVRATYGDSKTLRYVCQSCQEEQDLILTLSEDFKAREVEDVEATEFTYATSKGDAIVYRPAIGSDQMEAVNRKGATLPEQNTVILSRCIKTVNGHMVVDPLQYARSLGMIDRTKLMSLLMERQPSVDMTVTINCVACREEQVIPLGWGDIFRP